MRRGGRAGLKQNQKGVTHRFRQKFHAYSCAGLYPDSFFHTARPTAFADAHVKRRTSRLYMQTFVCVLIFVCQVSKKMHLVALIILAPVSSNTDLATSSYEGFKFCSCLNLYGLILENQICIYIYIYPRGFKHITFPKDASSCGLQSRTD